MALENADKPRPPAFPAGHSGTCSECDDEFDEGTMIRADGDGGWCHADPDECEIPYGVPAGRRQPPPATSTDQMGY